MSFQDTAPTSFPAQAGYVPLHPRFLTYQLDFTTYANLNIDLQRQQSHGRMEFVQSVYIDNSNNQSTLTLKFLGTGQVIVAQPLTQGDYPVKVGTGIIRFSAVATAGQVIPIIFSNMPAQGVVWGPTQGVLVTPALTNLAIDIAASAIGNNLLVAGVAATTIKVYRLFYVANGATNIRLVDSAANKWTGLMTTTPGGGAAFQATGVPWFTCAVGADLDLYTDAAVQIGGQVGYVQS
jgi:hypothetical protein